MLRIVKFPTPKNSKNLRKGIIPKAVRYVLEEIEKNIDIRVS